MIKNIILLITLVHLISCEKDESIKVNDYPTFKFEKFDNYSNFRLFTKNGEIFDKTILSQYKLIHENEIVKSQIRELPQPNEFTYINYDTVLSTTGKITEKLILNSSNNWNTYSSIDTTRVTPSIYHKQEDYINLYSNAGIYKPHIERKTEANPFSDFFSDYYTIVHTRIAKQENNKLIFPFMESIYLTDNSWSYRYHLMTNIINNKYNENFTEFMKKGDTLLLKEYDAIYYKD